MNYQETLDFLYNSLPMYQRQGKAAYKSDLNNSLAFDQHLDSPHQHYPCVHIAGTNGKGSCSHMLASVLQKAGYKVGLYTSPHLKSYRERIKINGEKISREYVTRFIENQLDFIKTLQPSFFEMTVFMAFQYFKEQKVDVAIIEVGMGGRLDSTNLIQPVLSVITNIGLDHTQFLGDNLTSIAKEKAGIVKSNTPVVIGETQEETKPVFISEAEKKQADIIFAEQVFQLKDSTNSSSQNATYQIKSSSLNFNDLELDLKGIYQQKNVLTVLAALEQLQAHFNISEEAIRQGLKTTVSTTGLLGRWQTLSDNPTVICDTGHNMAGVQQILSQLKQLEYRQLHLVWGMVNDKSIDEILSVLPKENCYYYFTKANIPRALDADILYQKAQAYGLVGECIGEVKEALQTARKNAQKDDLIFVGGSTFVVAEVV